jgi:hypothetical protein
MKCNVDSAGKGPGEYVTVPETPNPGIPQAAADPGRGLLGLRPALKTLRPTAVVASRGIMFLDVWMLATRGWEIGLAEPVAVSGWLKHIFSCPFLAHF